MLSRHGSRYPTSGSSVNDLGDRIAQAKAKGNFKAKDELSFLNDWKYELGYEILVPKGKWISCPLLLVTSFFHNSIFRSHQLFGFIFLKVVCVIMLFV